MRRSLADLLVQSGRPEAAANVYRDLVEDERVGGLDKRKKVGTPTMGGLLIILSTTAAAIIYSTSSAVVVLIIIITIPPSTTADQ